MTTIPAPAPQLGSTDDVALAERMAAARSRVLAEVRKRIVGQDQAVDLALNALFAGGHSLIVGVPGLAKTLLVSTLAQAVDLTFSRIQFTPDLMPSDITGTEIIQEDHAIVAIGGSVGKSEKVRKRVFRWIFKLFPDQNFHFLGGSSLLLQEFPWFSADSRGWIVGRQFGAIVDEQGQRKAPNGMDGLAALAYNSRYFSGLEWAA